MTDEEHHRTLLAKAAEYRAKAKAATDSSVGAALEAVAREYERLAAKLLLNVRQADSNDRRNTGSKR